MRAGARTEWIKRGVPSLVLAITALVVPAAAQHHMEMPGSGSTVRMPEGRASVRVPLDLSSSHIILQMTVNGSDLLSVVLDTGMPMPGLALFDNERTRALDLDFGAGSAQIGGAGGDGGHMQARIASGAVIALGEITFDGIRVIAMPPMPHFPIDHDGVIGAAIFRNFTVRIDYDKSEIKLYKPGSWEPEPGTATVPLAMRQGLPYVTAQLEKADGTAIEVEMVLDLGAGHPLSLNASSHEGISVPSRAVRRPIGRGLGGEIQGHVGRIPGLILGGIRLEDVIATFPDSQHENPRGIDSRNGNLGAGVMGRFNFTLDYSAGRMYLEPNRKFREPFEWDMSGMVLYPGEGGTLEVATVIDGAPAASAGMKEGDLILEVDGRKIAAGDREVVRKALRRDGAEVTLKFRRNGEVETVVLTLRRLV